MAGDERRTDLDAACRNVAHQQQHLIQTFPQQVGNTDGVPWSMRTQANTINISDAVISEQQRLNRSKDSKLVDYVRENYPDLDENQARNTLENLRANPELAQRAIGEMDHTSSDKISHYNGLLDQVLDSTLKDDFTPTAENDGMIERQILAFDPSGNGTSVELIGNIDKADSVGVLVPGMNTTLLGSHTNVDAATGFVEEGQGNVAMITYVGGEFPQGELNAASDQFAKNMAPDLVSFSEDVNRTVDATGRDVSVTYIGHSYGGSIVGTADHMGLTADRVLFVEAAGAGSGVQEPSDWHNTNPDVERYSMTAPGDLLEAAQGTWFDYGPARRRPRRNARCDPAGHRLLPREQRHGHYPGRQARRRREFPRRCPRLQVRCVGQHLRCDIKWRRDPVQRPRCRFPGDHLLGHSPNRAE